MTFQPVRGMHDLLAEEMRGRTSILSCARAVAHKYGMEDISTPLLERTEVFARTLGETSDVVTKEMYTFVDRSEVSLTLRPEGTAGVVRAFLGAGLSQTLPCRFFYEGPMFRRERPQKGRTRQFHQFGVEVLGVSQPEVDVEVLACGWAVLKALGVSQDVTLLLNTLGDQESRQAYKGALLSYFEPHMTRLSHEAKVRLKKNPLRLLDAKDLDPDLLEGAPSMVDFLTRSSHGRFERVLSGLEALKIPYTWAQRLVRGLDYYGHTAFEYATTTLGAQGAVLSGGRYDGLVEQMGGPATPGIGWAAGLDRLALMVPSYGKSPLPLTFVVTASEEEGAYAQHVAEHARASGLCVVCGYGSLKAQLRQANRKGASFVLFVGKEEKKEGCVTVRDFVSGKQQKLPLERALDHLL